MYTTFFRFFGLRENPFNINPDPSYLYLDQRIQTVLDNMASAIQARKGLIVLTGEPGTGKTTLLNRLIGWLQEQKIPTAFIFNPHLELNDLFDLLFANFGIPARPRHAANPWTRLSQWSIEQYRRGTNAVIILDEAQGLPIPLLAEIRLLLNHEIANEGLIQIVLSGQPELEAKLKKPELRQVRQRIGLRCQTTALTPEQAHGYIRKRIRLAGGFSENVFVPEAIDTAYHYSQGIPRVMNLLAEQAMIRAYLEQTQPISVCIVEEAARHLQFDDAKPVPGRISWEASLPSDLGIGLSARLEDQTAAVKLTTDERKGLPVAMPVVRESVRRTVLETAAHEGAAVGSELLHASPKPVENRAKVETTPISQIRAKTDSSRDLMDELILSSSSGVLQPKSLQRRATVFNFEKNSKASLNPPQVLLSYLSWGRGLRAALAVSSRWISRGRGEVLAFVRSRAWERSLQSPLRWVRRRVLTVLPHRSSFGRSDVLKMAKSMIRQTNIQSALRWLQQPLPTLKLHRRIGR
jgi:general secretion pathway protein A